MNDTPETDAQMAGNAYQADYWKNKYVPVDFARKLERERNEARTKSNGYQMSLEEEQEHHNDTKVERDLLRKVCDELFSLIEANHASSCSLQDPDEPHCDCGYQQHYEIALADYNSLLHVIERSK